MQCQLPTTSLPPSVPHREVSFITRGSAPGGGEHMVQMAQTLKGRVHAVNINGGALPDVSDGGFGDFVRTRIEPICQVACRDRNRTLQADLMGAHALASAIS